MHIVVVEHGAGQLRCAKHKSVNRDLEIGPFRRNRDLLILQYLSPLNCQKRPIYREKRIADTGIPEVRKVSKETYIGKRDLLLFAYLSSPTSLTHELPACIISPLVLCVCVCVCV
jgi:hypothetical protein